MRRTFIPLLTLVICGTIAAGPEAGNALLSERVLDQLQSARPCERLESIDGNGTVAAMGTAKACSRDEIIGCPLGCGNIDRPGDHFAPDCPFGPDCAVPDCDSPEDPGPGPIQWIPLNVCFGYAGDTVSASMSRNSW